MPVAWFLKQNDGFDQWLSIFLGQLPFVWCIKFRITIWTQNCGSSVTFLGKWLPADLEPLNMTIYHFSRITTDLLAKIVSSLHTKNDYCPVGTYYLADVTSTNRIGGLLYCTCIYDSFPWKVHNLGHLSSSHRVKDYNGAVKVTQCIYK